MTENDLEKLPKICQW